MDKNGAGINPEENSPDDKTATDKQKLVAALLFGLDHLDDTRTNDGSGSPSLTRAQSSATTRSNTDSSTSTPPTRKPSSIDSILSFVDRHIPSDSTELRSTPLYQTAHAAARFQRDQYLVGPRYASWRSRRQRPPRILPYDRTALGHRQLRPIAAQFITTETVIRALTPLIAYELPPVAFPVLADATVQIVESQQQALNSVMQQSLLQLLQQPENRQRMKRSMIATYHDNATTTSTADATKNEN